MEFVAGFQMRSLECQIKLLQIKSIKSVSDLQIFDIRHQVFVNADMEICADYEQKSGC